MWEDEDYEPTFSLFLGFDGPQLDKEAANKSSCRLEKRFGRQPAAAIIQRVLLKDDNKWSVLMNRLNPAFKFDVNESPLIAERRSSSARDSETPFFDPSQW